MSLLIKYGKLKDFSRSHAVTYTEEVEASQKQCKTQTLLVQTTNKMWHVAYRIFQVTFSDIRGRSPIARIYRCDFSHSHAAAEKSSTDCILHACVVLQASKQAVSLLYN